MKIDSAFLGILALAYPIEALQAAAIAEQRRKNEEQIASALGVPAHLLFSPLVQSLLTGPLLVDRFKAFTPSPSPRRAARRRHNQRMKRR